MKQQFHQEENKLGERRVTFHHVFIDFPLIKSSGYEF